MSSCTQISYLYRDGDNYKQHGEIFLEGVLNVEAVAMITSKLDEGEYFIPYDLCLEIPELQLEMRTPMGASDHAWHELKIDSITELPSLPEGAGTLDAADFVQAFRNIESPSSWNLLGAMQRLGIPA